LALAEKEQLRIKIQHWSLVTMTPPSQQRPFWFHRFRSATWNLSNQIAAFRSYSL